MRLWRPPAAAASGEKNPATGAISLLRRRSARTAACERGGAAVEFALVLPVFLLIVGGLVEFGMVAWSRNTLEYAVEEAARYGALDPVATETQVINVVKDQASGLDPADVVVSVNFEMLGATRTFINVQGTYQYNYTMPLPLTPITLVSTARLAIPD